MDLVCRNFVAGRANLRDQLWPTQIAWDNRMFLIHQVRFLAHRAGITQFLDCGSGLPTADNTHQVAQRIQPKSRVVYVDNDPVVLTYGSALLQDNDQAHLIDADSFEPRQIIHDETVRKHLDFSEPIALLQNGALHHYDGTRSPADVMREYVDALPSGSYVGISHFLDPETSEYSKLARRIEQVFLHSPLGCGWFRTRAEIENMFPGASNCWNPASPAALSGGPTGLRSRRCTPSSIASPVVSAASHDPAVKHSARSWSWRAPPTGGCRPARWRRRALLVGLRESPPAPGQELRDFSKVTGW